MRRNEADTLYSRAVKRYNTAYPGISLPKKLLDTIWYELYGMLCRGEKEQAVAVADNGKLYTLEEIERMRG